MRSSLTLPSPSRHHRLGLPHHPSRHWVNRLGRGRPRWLCPPPGEVSSRAPLQNATPVMIADRTATKAPTVVSIVVPKEAGSLYQSPRPLHAPRRLPL